jgi:hypothetical protein
MDLWLADVHDALPAGDMGCSTGDVSRSIDLRGLADTQHMRMRLAKLAACTALLVVLAFEKTD